MKKSRKYIKLLATMGVFLISGCGAKAEVQEIPDETFFNEVLSSVEEQTIDVDETQSETPVQNEASSNTESASESEPGSEQEANTTQKASAQEVKYMDIAHVFNPYEQAIEISFQIPEDWEYTIEDIIEEYPDWGYSVKAFGREDTHFYIVGQFGTMTVADYSNGPNSFQTSQGLTGQYSWDEYMLDDGSPAVQGQLVFDTELVGFYGVSFNLPKSVYSENKDIIDKVFQSIVIRQAQ
ncbi:MAG: hypothetical protein K2O99_07150 [Lachnospiraceae bacterium]|nr:hypothetical protein [Lachnospiraceae bacterium]